MDDRWVVEFRLPNSKWEIYNSYATRAEALAKVASSRSERWPKRYEFRCRRLTPQERRSERWTT